MTNPVSVCSPYCISFSSFTPVSRFFGIVRQDVPVYLLYTDSTCWKLILFGANDACLPDAPTKQHVPLPVYKNNLKTIVTHPSVVAHHPKIILLTPPPIDEVRQEETDASKGNPLCRRANTTAKYAEAVRQVGAEVGGDLLVLDLWTTIMEEALKKTPSHDSNGAILGSKELGSSKALNALLPDGLHFGGAGYAIFFQALLSAIDGKWPDLAAPQDSYVFPEWRVAPSIRSDTS
jgi:lysophospholipase L1-like esterase